MDDVWWFDMIWGYRCFRKPPLEWSWRLKMWFVPQSLIFEHYMSSFAMASRFNGLQTWRWYKDWRVPMHNDHHVVVPKIRERHDEQRARATCCLVFPSGDPGVSLKMGDPHMTMGFNTQMIHVCHIWFAIYHQYTPNVGINLPYMDPMGILKWSQMGRMTWIFWGMARVAPWRHDSSRSSFLVPKKRPYVSGLDPLSNVEI